MGDRFLHGYPKGGRWHTPAFRTVAMYVDQKPEGSLAQQRAEAFGVTLYDSVAEAVCCGGAAPPPAAAATPAGAPLQLLLPPGLLPPAG